MVVQNVLKCRYATMCSSSTLLPYEHLRTHGLSANTHTHRTQRLHPYPYPHPRARVRVDRGYGYG